MGINTILNTLLVVAVVVGLIGFIGAMLIQHKKHQVNMMIIEIPLLSIRMTHDECNEILDSLKIAEGMGANKRYIETARLFVEARLKVLKEK